MINLSKVSLPIVLISTLLVSFQTEASLIRKIHERRFTKNEKLLRDPKYILSNIVIKEISDSELLAIELGFGDSIFENFSPDEMNESFIVPKVNTVRIPGGVPGVDANDTETSAIVIPNSNIRSNTNLAVGTGAGGTTATGASVTDVLDGVIAITDKLVAIGTKILGILDKGRPVVTSKPMSAISVLPRLDAKDPVVHDMGNWSLPENKKYRVTFKNGLGGTAVDFIYSISFQHSGTYAGKGHYLAGVRVYPRSITGNWMFDFDVASQLVQISNVGTVDNIIAAATLDITYTLKNSVRQIMTTDTFTVTGEGKIYKSN